MIRRFRSRSLGLILASLAIILTIYICYSISPPLSPETEPQLREYKYFWEQGSSEELSHYDKRYFVAIVPIPEKAESLRNLMQAYLDFFELNNIETWLAHGTLLGWWWNGKNLPWDADIDTQVSIETLNLLGSAYNQTMYTHSITNTRYMLDVNIWISQRVYAEGLNAIDARWIDTSNGLYVDITGLAETHPVEKPGVIQCKNNHFYHAADIYPLRSTVFEDRPALVPFAYSDILQGEYGSKSMSQTRWSSFRWDILTEKWA